MGTDVFIKYGWRAGAALSMGWYGWQLAILLVRGPHCERYTWLGYEGGLAARSVGVEQKPIDQPSSPESTDPPQPTEKI